VSVDFLNIDHNINRSHILQTSLPAGFLAKTLPRALFSSLTRCVCQEIFSQRYPRCLFFFVSFLKIQYKYRYSYAYEHPPL
jgi:hypothetical protein